MPFIVYKNTDVREILDYSFQEIKEFFLSIGVEKFRAQQLWNWIYVKGVKDFDLMLNMKADLKNILKQNFSLIRPIIHKELISTDQTKKWLLNLQDNNTIETVFIPEENRGTLCVSSQVGCTLNCKFCYTGTQRMVRNLTSGEIIGQLLLAQDVLRSWPYQKKELENSTIATTQIGIMTPKRILSNIVFMGMGEPMINYENIARAVKIMTDHDGLNISKHKITLSTSGVLERLDECAEDLGINLAISLHAVADDLRNELVPINKRYPIAELIAACRRYSQKTSGKRITFEYVMLQNVNDHPNDARALVKLIAGIPAKINLIPFNPWPNSPYQCSDNQNISRFANIIEAAGYQSPVRVTRGQDIMAACGQLKSDSIKLRKFVN